jgi:glycine C-acetyltransferase
MDMALDKLDRVLTLRLQELETQGRCKGEENIIRGIKPAGEGHGPRCFLVGYGNREFLPMNSNSYLGLSMHPQVISAEEHAAREFGTGPGAVRFINGTYQSHVTLEKELAAFHNREAAMIFSAAYAAIMGVLPQLIDEDTVVLSDSLNHNCIINAIRLARPTRKHIYRHLDIDDLEAKIRDCIGQAQRLLVVTDGIFSMRGDYAPLDALTSRCRRYEERFEQGIVTVVDDSHGIGALGQTGRGVEEFTDSRADILVATLGKALGVNGGYVVASRTAIDFLRETAPFYIYSNPITPSEAAAASQALTLLDSSEGRKLLDRLRRLTRRFKTGLRESGFEILAGEHPIVPLMIRDTQKTAHLVHYLFSQNILATGLNFPVVPKGDEEIRFQISASHTEKDIDYVLTVLAHFARQER